MTPLTREQVALIDVMLNHAGGIEADEAPDVIRNLVATVEALQAEKAALIESRDYYRRRHFVTVEQSPPDATKVLGWLRTQRRHYHGYPEIRGAYTEVIDCINALVATVEAQATQLADAQQMLRNVLVQVSDALGLPLTEAGRPRANSFLYREIGRFIECHDWDWPPEHPGEVDAIRRARAETREDQR